MWKSGRWIEGLISVSAASPHRPFVCVCAFVCVRFALRVSGSLSHC